MATYGPLATVADVEAVPVKSIGPTNNEHLVSLGPDARNTINSAGVATVSALTLLGQASTGAGHHIASKTNVPAVGPTSGMAIYADWDNDDSTTSSNGNGVNLASIVSAASIIGSYDSVVNSTGSAIVAGPHSYIRYSEGGHDNIFGGSTNLIAGTGAAAGRNGIFASTNCGVLGDTAYSSIYTSVESVIKNGSRYAVMVGGYGRTIDNGDYVVAFNGSMTNCLRTMAAFGTVSNATDCIGLGESTWNATVTDVQALGLGHVVSHTRNVILGKDGKTFSADSNQGVVSTVAGKKVSLEGDNQVSTFVVGRSGSAGAAATLNLTLFSSTDIVAITGRISIIGVETADPTKYCSYDGDLTLVWNGPAGTLNIFDAAGTGTSDLYRDPKTNSTLAVGAGNAGKFRIAANTGSFRVVTPTPTNAVKWSASFTGTVTRLA